MNFMIVKIHKNSKKFEIDTLWASVTQICKEILKFFGKLSVQRHNRVPKSEFLKKKLKSTPKTVTLIGKFTHEGNWTSFV